MKTSEHELEWVAEIWNKQGECLQIGEDRDGLDLTEIRWRDDTGKIGASVSFPADALPLVIRALQRRLELAEKADDP